jgi:putative glycerol-1-phosphate prenyltransferase
MNQSLLTDLYERKSRRQKSLAILIDPDKASSSRLERIADFAQTYRPDYFFVGGSLITSGDLNFVLTFLKKQTDIPIILFPGNNYFISSQADAVLFLSLISGRNPEYLIGQHIVAAPILKRSGLEILPTAYILIDCGNPTTVSYISNTTPIPYDKPEIAATTAMAGEMLGLKITYLDGGSGASKPVSPITITSVSQAVDTPIIVGGGIKTSQQAIEAYRAGADLVVVGTAVEETDSSMKDFCQIRNLISLPALGES